MFSNNLINVLPKCDLKLHVVESVVRKRKSWFCQVFHCAVNAKVGHLRCGWLGLDWREGLEVRSLCWLGKEQSSQEENIEERSANGKHGMEGMAVGITLLATFPLPEPQNTLEHGGFCLPRIPALHTPLCCGARGGEPILAAIFQELQVAEAHGGCECPTRESIHPSRGALAASLYSLDLAGKN